MIPDTRRHSLRDRRTHQGSRLLRRWRVRGTRDLRLVGSVLLRCAQLICWTGIGWIAVLELPPIAAGALLALLLGALGWRFVLRRGRGRRRERASLRLRGFSGSGPWIAAAVPVWIVFNASLLGLHTLWIAPPPAPPPWLEEVGGRPLGWLPLLLMSVAIAPLAEEIFFRGYVQRALERRMGAAAGVVGAALVFAAIHAEPWRFVYLVTGGLVFGIFVLAARSLWAGVALHVAANGSLALLSEATAWDPSSGLAPRSPGGAFALHVVFLVTLGALVALHSRVRSAARRRPRERSDPTLHSLPAPGAVGLSPVPPGRP